MCVRQLIAVVFTISLLSPGNAQTSVDYHEEEGESMRASGRETEHQPVGESEREIHQQERVRLAALEAELQEELKLVQAANEEDGLGAIPGQPGHDYPAYTTVPRTSFTCADKLLPGYYADVEARCQVFHICEPSGAKHSFLCPRGSLFNQKYLVCDWWYTSECVPSSDLQVYQLDFNRLDHIKDSSQQNEFPQHANFVSDNVYISGGEENYILSQSDIFHSAETGVPNRERYESSKDLRKDNGDDVKKSSEGKSNRVAYNNGGNSTSKS